MPINSESHSDIQPTPHDTRPWEALAPGELWRGRYMTGISGLPPVAVLAARGKLDGPRVTVFGAVHGDEYEGTAAIHAFFNELTPEDLEEVGGLLVGIPVANGAAWAARTRTTPQDGLDLNRCFPGIAPEAAAAAQAAGSPVAVTRQLAHVLFSTFVAPTDVIIDLHSGGVRLVHLPMIGWGSALDAPPENTGRAEALARIFGFDFYPWQVGSKEGVLTHEATRAGKIALGAEWAGGGSLDPAGMGAYAEGIRRIVSVLGTPPPWSYEMDPRPPLAGDYAAAPAGGIFYPAVALGDRVQSGDLLGTVTDDLGDLTATLTADRTGLVAGLAHPGRIQTGDPFVYIG